MFSCKTSPVEERIIYKTILDTIFINNEQIIIDIKYNYNKILDSIKNVNDSIEKDLFICKYKLNRIEYYTNIVDKKPSQIKYYKGWVKRALK